MHKNWRMKLQYIYMMFGAGNNQQVITRIKKQKTKQIPSQFLLGGQCTVVAYSRVTTWKTNSGKVQLQKSGKTAAPIY